jgi:hypothetical protein
MAGGEYAAHVSMPDLRTGEIPALTTSTAAKDNNIHRVALLARGTACSCKFFPSNCPSWCFQACPLRVSARPYYFRALKTPLKGLFASTRRLLPRLKTSESVLQTRPSLRLQEDLDKFTARVSLPLPLLLLLAETRAVYLRHNNITTKVNKSVQLLSPYQTCHTQRTLSPLNKMPAQPAVRSEAFFAKSAKADFMRTRASIARLFNVLDVSADVVDEIIDSAFEIWEREGPVNMHQLRNDPQFQARHNAAITELLLEYPHVFGMQTDGPEEEKFVRDKAPKAMIAVSLLAVHEQPLISLTCP